MTESERKAFRAQRRRELRSSFPVPYLQTDTSLHLGDGFENDGIRRIAYARARAAGIDPNGKIYMTGLSDDRGYEDPDAWVPHYDFRSRVAQVCHDRGHSCDGTVNVKPPELESDPLDEPYRVDPEAIDWEVDEINEEHHGGQMTEKQKTDLHEELAEKYAGAP